MDRDINIPCCTLYCGCVCVCVCVWVYKSFPAAPMLVRACADECVRVFFASECCHACQMCICMALKILVRVLMTMCSFCCRCVDALSLSLSVCANIYMCVSLCVDMFVCSMSVYSIFCMCHHRATLIVLAFHWSCAHAHGGGQLCGSSCTLLQLFTPVHAGIGGAIPFLGWDCAFVHPPFFVHVNSPCSLFFQRGCDSIFFLFLLKWCAGSVRFRGSLAAEPQPNA